MSDQIEPAGGPASPTRRLALRGRTLRQAAARGTVVNAIFLTLLSSLQLVRGFVLASYLTREDYGLWGILIISLGTLLWLKQVGIGDKYIQQDEADQERAFQKAFTLEAMFTGIFTLLILIAIPIMAIVYNQPGLVAPGLVLVLVLPSLVLQAPLWVFYREMRFFQQRLLQAVDPVVGFVVAVALGAAGAGYWALVFGVLAGSWAAALVAVWASPYRLRFRYDRGTLRSYAAFSWPLFIASGAGIVIAQASTLAGNDAVGIAGVGAITLAATISQFGDRVDGIVSGTLYPAICAVAEQTHLLYESFVKSNRLALMWAVPFGTGLALFAPDLVSFGIGERWRPAVIVIQIFGLGAALNHLGFNWDSYFRARGDTRPIAVAAATSMFTFLAVAVPLLYINGLEGFAIGMGVQALAGLFVRSHYLRRLFVGFGMLRHTARAIAPTIPAAAVVLGARLLESGERSGGIAAAELGVYIVVTLIATCIFERDLLREAIGYVRARTGGPDAAPTAVG